MTLCLHTVCHMASGVGNNDVGYVLKQVVKISDVICEWALRCLTFSPYTMATNGALGAKCDVNNCLVLIRGLITPAKTVQMPVSSRCAAVPRAWDGRRDRAAECVWSSRTISAGMHVDEDDGCRAMSDKHETTSATTATLQSPRLLPLRALHRQRTTIMIMIMMMMLMMSMPGCSLDTCSNGRWRRAADKFAGVTWLLRHRFISAARRQSGATARRLLATFTSRRRNFLWCLIIMHATLRDISAVYRSGETNGAKYFIHCLQIQIHYTQHR